MAEFPKIMGILNCTPDSFSDGGDYTSVTALVERALKMEEEGAHIIDIGGESTRPQANPVSAEEELTRVIPVIEEIRKKSDIPMSIDTTKAVVARAALKAGANLVNDVSALEDPHMANVIKDEKIPVILMHRRGNPQTMQSLATYHHVVDEVRDELNNRIEKAQKEGIEKKYIWIDPGFGFSKKGQDNLRLLQNLEKVKQLGYPLVVGVSRKSFIGDLIGETDPKKRDNATLILHHFALLKGADVLRVHDVAATQILLALFRTYSQETCL